MASDWLGRFGGIGEEFDIVGVEPRRNRVIRINVSQGLVAVKYDSTTYFGGLGSRNRAPAEFVVYQGKVFAKDGRFQIVFPELHGALRWPTRGY